MTTTLNDDLNNHLEIIKFLGLGKCIGNKKITNIIRTFKIKWEFFNQKKNDNNQRNKTKIANPSVLITSFYV